jgi:D-alanine-D-alanine ligase
MAIEVDPEWWKTLFDEIYLLTDARSVCDEEITRREVDLICEVLSIRPDDRILDLCGGHGRHSLELCSRGVGHCTLLDYSPPLIENARSCAAQFGYDLRCVQADARTTGLPDAAFDHVILMGNSLGYLADADADRHILEEAHRLLRVGGWLLVDVVDGNALRSSFNPNAWHESGPETVVCRQREIRGDQVYAREMVLSKSSGLVRDRAYSIRLYTAETVLALIESSGFKAAVVCAEFSSHRLKADYGFMNRRIVASGQKLQPE